MSIEIHPAPDLYCIEFERYPGDLGVSVVLPATCGLAARLRALTLFPEFRHSGTVTNLYPVKYAEIDWNSGRTIVVRREKPLEIPPCIAEKAKARRKKLPRIEEEGTE